MGNRKFLLSSPDGYGSGYYGSGYYGGYLEITVADDWKFTNSINALKTCNFTIVDNPNSVTIQKGLDIIMLVDDDIKFGGIIKTVQPYEDEPGFLYYDIDCYTYEKLTTKRRISAIFENKSMGYIARYILNNYLSEENIILGAIHDGKTFDRVVFNQKTCEEALNLLQSSSPGYNWNISVNKELFFVEKATYTCTTVIDDSFQHSGFKPVDTLDEYRNIQIVNGGLRLLNEITDWIPTPKPDGKSREFTVKFPIGKEPTIYIDSVAIPSTDVGVNGYDTGMKWYWSYNSDKLTQDDSETVLSDSQEIKVDFQGLLKTNLKYEDSDKITERADVEGTSGKYEEVCNNQDITSLKAATEYAKALVDKYEDQSYVDLIVENDIGDLEVNKLVKVEKSLFGIDDYYLVESINAETSNGDNIIYTIKLLSGEFVGNWEDYLKSLLTQENNINADDVIINYKSTQEEFYYSGEIEVASIKLLAPSTGLAPSVNLAPGIALEKTSFYEGYTVPSSYYNYMTKIAEKGVFVSSWYPDVNYDGSWGIQLYWGGLADSLFGLVYFDLDDLIGSGKNIYDAKLKLYRSSSFSGDMTSHLRIVNQSWDDTTVTYNSIKNYIETSEYSEITHAHGVAYDVDEYDITSLIQDIVDETITTYEGFCIWPYSPSYSWFSWFEERQPFFVPKIELTFLES